LVVVQASRKLSRFHERGREKPEAASSSGVLKAVTTVK